MRKGIGHRARFAAALVLGFASGGVLAFLSGGALAYVEGRAIQTTVDGWSSARQCGEPGNDLLVQAGCAQVLPAVNVPQEAVYWTATADSSAQVLSGQHQYVLHFAPGGLPPNDAFWSLTMTDARARLVPNPAERYAVGDRSGLEPNADGSVDVYLQAASPSGHEANWLPAPPGDFMLWLRAYQPRAAILDGSYKPPPVVEVASGGAAGAPSSDSSGRVPWFRILLALAVVAIVVGTMIRLRGRRARRRRHGEEAGPQRRLLARHPHRLTFGVVALMAWVVGTPLYLSIYPSLIYNAWEQAIVNHGLDTGSSSGIPVNTLYAVPELASPSAGGVLLTTGANVDTLYVGGWLDLSAQPQVLHVPDMAGRYYCVQFVDPRDGTDFAYVGRRTTGTAAGTFLITGPGWSGVVPTGVQRVSSPSNSVFLIGRVLVENADDLANAYSLAKQVGLTPLGR
jgi:hypothetical protein